MNLVLLSGGSGKRLWPLSNDTLSKQFLKLLENDKGEYESMVQRVTRQLFSVHSDIKLYVSCNSTQTDILHRQIGSVETISEPSRRDTFPAIVLAAAYLRYVKNMGENDVFVVCPIDVFAENKYFQLLNEVEKLAYIYKVGLLGVKPTYPSEKYGYILQKDKKVKGFVEKPSSSSAIKLIEEGALWNCCVFSLKIGYVLNYAKKYIEFNDYESLYEQYSKLPKISIDYEIIEKETSIGVDIYDGVWKDLGTWNTLTEEMNVNTIGKNVLVSDNCQNTHVLNMLNIPIIAQDLKDIVVVASYDGILVTSKPGSSYMKPLTEQINLQPMYEQRRWGNYRVLDHKDSDRNASIIKRIVVEAGSILNEKYNSILYNTWVVLNGKGILTVDGVDSVVKSGSVVQLYEGIGYSLLAATDVELIEVLQKLP